MPDLQGGESVVGSRTFATMSELLWYNCSPVCGSFSQRFYGGANGDLLQEDLCHTLPLPGLLQSEHLTPWQATADLCLCRRHSNTQGRSESVSCGEVTAPFPGSWYARFLFVPLDISNGKDLIPNAIALLLPSF